MLSKDNPMFASLKDKALKLQADAQIAAQSSLDSAKQKVAASVDVAKLQKLKEDALAKGSELKESAMTRVASGSLLGAGPSVRGPSPMPPDDEAMSADEATAEKERLVGGPDLRAGVSALGSRFFTGARSVSSKGVESLRSAGSAACASGTEKLTALKAAKDGAKERCGEALSAASAVSGVSLGGLGEKMAIGGKAREPPKTALGRLCARCPALTYKQRLVGAVACMVVGWLLSLSSLLSFTRLLLGNPLPFAYKYTLGNLLSLGATSFIVGPARQCRDMLHPSRRAASLLYFTTLVGTLLSVFVLKVALLCVLFILLQFMALAWYMLSYIPYGQAAASRIVRRIAKRAGVTLPGGGGGGSGSSGSIPMSAVAAEGSAGSDEKV